MNLSQLFVDSKNQLHAATDKWRNGNLTNFEYIINLIKLLLLYFCFLKFNYFRYLMFLNKLAGRSFNDMMYGFY